MDYIYIYLSGILSFLTPCILPILPFFISSVLGVSRTQITKKELLLRTLMFCLGFAIVLLGLGAGISLITANANKNFLQIIAGVIMLIFSLYYLEFIEIPFFNKTISTNKKTFTKSNYINSLILGILFSITWSPCLSPVMASVLSYVAIKNTSTISSIFKMLMFSFGVSTPLIIATFFWNNISGFFKKNSALPVIIKKVLGTLVLLFSLSIIFEAAAPKKSSPDLHEGHDHSLSSIRSYNENTILMVYSLDCYYCELATKTMKKIEDNCKNIKLDYIDINNPDSYIVLEDMNIMGTPAFIFYNKNNELIDTISGYVEDKYFIKKINDIFKTNCKI